MGAAAIAARIPLRTPARSRSTASPLAFERTGGPLVALCGLAGGAGTTTLALMLAHAAAAESSAPVLLTEFATDSGGLAAATGQTGPASLATLARRVADGEVPQEAFVELAPRLRLIATAPATLPSPDPDALRALLEQARAAHGLTILDCGTDHAAARAVSRHASHVVWTMPATPAGVARARALLASDVAPPPGGAREVLAAVASDHQSSVRVRALRQLARSRCDRVVLIPHSRALDAGDHGIAAALTALATTFRSVP
jgi:Flp pilus assembly CpaE family ATPase